MAKPVDRGVPARWGLPRGSAATPSAPALFGDVPARCTGLFSLAGGGRLWLDAGVIPKKKMGLFMATILVLVNMVGTGIFLLPVSMASVGSISVIGWLVAGVGAAAIGLMFAMLGAIKPEAGGPYAYAREALGPYLGFQTNYIYWSANLVGNIAVATTVTGYFTELIPALGGGGREAVFSILVIWVATAVNIAGPRWVGFFTGWGTVLAMLPLVAIAIIGWFWFNPSVFWGSWNPHHETAWDGISTSAAFALWAFMGVESAAVASDVIENPKRNVPLATMIGLLIAALLYISTCTVLMGILPAEELAKSSAPFADAAGKIFGPAGAVIIALCAIFKAGSSLVGWTLTISQSAAAAARDGLFPKVFARVDRRGIAYLNLVVAGVLMSLIVVVTAAPTLARQFNEIIDMAIILTILPYMYSGIAFLRLGIVAGTTRWHHYLVVAIVAVVSIYCLWVVAGSDADLTRSAMIVLFASVPLYPLLARGLKDTAALHP
jgi:arginine:agmatine antiporter